jgi:hypothetical protein
MTRILNITGNGDYCLYHFKDLNLDNVETWEKAYASPDNEIEIKLDDENEGEVLYVKAYLFGDMDPKFLEFADDQQKNAEHSGFIIID